MKQLITFFLFAIATLAQPALAQPTVCQDLTDNNSSDEFPGIYGGISHSMDYSGEAQTVNLGIYGYLDNAAAELTLFSVNGSAPVSLADIGFSTTIGGVQVQGDQSGAAAELVSNYLTSSLPDFTARVYNFYGQIDNISITLFESGIVYSCVEESEIITDCVDDFEGDLVTPGFPSGYIIGTHSFAFDGNEQIVDMGYYDWATWEQIAEDDSGDQTFFAVNGSELIPLDSILANQPLAINGVMVSIDQTPLGAEYELVTGMTSGTISFSGEVELVVTQQIESGLVFICTSTEAEENDCDDFTSASNPAGQPGLYQFTDIPLSYDGSNQTVSMGIYGFFNSWDTSDLWQANGTLFSINGGEPISLDSIVNHMPLEIDGISIMVDTATLGGDYDLASMTNWTSGTVIFSGEITGIVMTPFESGLIFSCTEEINTTPQPYCDDFTSASDPIGQPGIYQFSDISLSYDGNYQSVALGIYGFFSNWDSADLGQAQETYFSINGSEAISLEMIYNQMPLEIGGVTLTVDTGSLAFQYDVSTWTSGMVFATGEVETIVMTPFESGLLFSCVEYLVTPVDCELEASYTYSAFDLYHNFIGTGNGTEYTWDFGDGATSDLQNPQHDFETDGIYTVCLTNFNLTDTCSMTYCQDIMVEQELAGAPGDGNVITPDGDGLNDDRQLDCNDVTIYDRNGIVVAQLQGQSSWDGRNDAGNALPMGEYIIRCNLDDSVVKLTILR